MFPFDEQPDRFEPNLQLINHLKTIPGLDFETLHPSQFPRRLYDPVLIKAIGLNKRNATTDSVNRELTRILVIADKHMSTRASNSEEDVTACLDSMLSELRAKPGKRLDMGALINLVSGLCQTRYRYWHTNPQEVADTLLQCHIDLVVLQFVASFGLLELGPGRQPERLATPALLQEMIGLTRRRRDELLAEVSGSSDISIAPQARPENAGPSTAHPFTQEEHEAVFQDSNLADMINDLGNMIGHPGGGNPSS